MSKELTVSEETQRAVQNYTHEDVELIKSTICKGATDSEFKLFMYQARVTGLNPLARQIYSIERSEKRGDSWVKTRTIQTSIDGFRLIAERSGKYAGQLGPLWCGKDGKWHDAWLTSEPPVAAKIGVIRHDFKEPCWGVARFDAYAQKKDGKPTRMWFTMGDVMLAKCAEALALRKAFPQELSGLYTNDEMAQSTEEQPEVVSQAVIEQPKKEPTPKELEELALAEEAKKYYAEIELCDTPEKLELVVNRYTATMAKLLASLPKWHARLVEILNQKRASYEERPDALVIPAFLKREPATQNTSNIVGAA